MRFFLAYQTPVIYHVFFVRNADGAKLRQEGGDQFRQGCLGVTVVDLAVKEPLSSKVSLFMAVWNQMYRHPQSKISTMPDKENFQQLQNIAVDGPQGMLDLCKRLHEEFFHDPVVFLLLDGELGAGKTTFCQGLRPVLGIEENITSPSFNLLNQYQGSKGNLYHYDLYRLNDPAQVEELGFPELWSEPQGDLPSIHAIEWWRRAGEFLPVTRPTFLLEFQHDWRGDESRRDLRLYRMTHDLPGF